MINSGCFCAYTVGYGDLSPVTEEGRKFVGFFIPIAAAVMFNATTLIASQYMVWKGTVLSTVEELRHSNGTMSVEEYQIQMLLRLGKVQGPLLAQMEAQFRNMDLNADGSLTVHRGANQRGTKPAEGAGESAGDSPKGAGGAQIMHSSLEGVATIKRPGGLQRGQQSQSNGEIMIMRSSLEGPPSRRNSLGQIQEDPNCIDGRMILV